ncbi:MAG: heparan-alpha-glucosaminide N-acetyltransferase domain-containing protein [Clostridia bacterium]|nr:heparan-alpha-glucosaminide N-acetyltransferase domain-containing protein [Clostridia bacterium]
MKAGALLNGKKTGRSDRIWELDFLRGVCVLLMIFDHTMFDIGFLFADAWKAVGKESLTSIVNLAASYYKNSALRHTTQNIVVWIFALLCGISCSFSRNNLKRGVQAAIISAIITVVTYFMNETVKFGILHMFAFAILFWWLIDTLCCHKKMITAGVCLFLGIMIIVVNDALMDIYVHNKTAFASDSSLYFIGEFMIGKPSGFTSSDYYPIFPTVGYMLLGAAAAVILYPKKKSLLPWLGKYDWHAPFSFWGRIAIWVYALHQVAVVVILALISFLFITPGDFVVI